MIMARNEDGTYSQVGFVKDNAGIDTEYIYDKDGDIVFEKGFTRETSGIVPLTINGIGKDLKDWSITGNTVQTGTPTPENPIEVQAVGDRTGNLIPFSYYTGTKSFDGISWTMNSDGRLTGEGISTKGTNYYIINQLRGFSLKAGDYTLSFQGTKNRNLILRDVTAGINIARCDGTNKEVSFTLSEDSGVLQLYFNSSAVGVEFDIDGYPMLNSGSTPLPYEPYGYKIPVVTRGKNLLKLKEVNLTIRGVAVSVKNNSITVKGTSTLSGGRTNYLSESFVLQPGTYFISGDIVKSMAYCLTNKSNGNAVVASSYTLKFTLTEKTEVAFGLNFISGISYDATVNVMLNEGDKILPYEPYHEPITTPIYLDSPLYKIGDYADSIGVTEEVRSVKELILTGEETWQIYSVNNIHQFYVSLPIDKLSIIGLSAYSNIAGYGATAHDRGNYEFGCYTVTDGTQIAFQMRGAKEQFSSISAWKAYLAAQYAAGTPVKVYYVMKTPETKAVEPAEIPTLNGTTVIDVDTAVKPTEMYTKYKSSK